MSFGNDPVGKKCRLGEGWKADCLEIYFRQDRPGIRRGIEFVPQRKEEILFGLGGDLGSPERSPKVLFDLFQVEKSPNPILPQWVFAVIRTV